MTIRRQILERVRRAVRSPRRPIEPIRLTERQVRMGNVAQINALNKIHVRLSSMRGLIEENRALWEKGNARSRIKYGKIAEATIDLSTKLGFIAGLLTGVALPKEEGKAMGGLVGAVAGRAIGHRVGKITTRQILKLHPTSRDYRVLVKALRPKLREKQLRVELHSMDITRNRILIGRLTRAIETLMDQNRTLRQNIILGKVRKIDRPL